VAANDYTGKHRSGQGSPGYARGRREKPGSHNTAGMNPVVSANFGVMTAGNIMAVAEHHRQKEYNIAVGRENMSKAAHPSAGSRSAEFTQNALGYAKAAGASYANMQAARRTAEPVGRMIGRQIHFDLGRRAGFSGLN
jgi:hypothetical protein